jgi:FdhD protein
MLGCQVMSRNPSGEAVETWPTTFFVDGARHELPDPLVVEEALEILLGGPEGDARQLAVTMRTPGHDAELVDTAAELAALEPAGATATPGAGTVRRFVARLHRASDAEGAPRPFLSTAACGLCGRGSLDAAFATGFPPLPAGPRVTADLLQSLPDRMRAAQRVFSETGGLHAAALFDAAGNLELLREDVGRHNAVDKVVGRLLLDGRLPASGYILAVSGRVGFEVAQKALRAGFPVLVAVGAPSALAVRLASRAGMTLAGFVRPGRCNLYSGVERLD